MCHPFDDWSRIVLQHNSCQFAFKYNVRAQWLSGRVLDSRPKGCGFEPHRRHCVVSLSKNINPSLVLVQPRKTRPFITERLLMGRKELNQTNQKQCINSFTYVSFFFYLLLYIDNVCIIAKFACQDYDVYM